MSPNIPSTNSRAERARSGVWDTDLISRPKIAADGGCLAAWSPIFDSRS